MRISDSWKRNWTAYLMFLLIGIMIGVAVARQVWVFLMLPAMMLAFLVVGIVEWPKRDTPS